MLDFEELKPKISMSSNMITGGISSLTNMFKTSNEKQSWDKLSQSTAETEKPNKTLSQQEPKE